MHRSFVLGVAMLAAFVVGQASQAAAVGQWQVGTHYVQLPAPQPTRAAKGKIEVIEIFWYGCGHCYALDPTLESWDASKPANVEFSRMHVMWGPPHRQHARLFYTLQALSRTDLHTKVFETIHRAGNPLAAMNDAAARELHKTFLLANGVTEKDFDAAYESMSVETNLKRAEEATVDFQVESVPLLIVNGKYTTTVGMAGGPAQLVALLNALVASEKGR
jgi:protein dithiol oxidoreductase (disulfide-forming)